jgi:hypothetical protein
MLDVSDISCLHAMLSNQPELVSDVSIAHRRPPWLARLPSFCFEQRISGQRQTHRKRELDWRVQHVFLKRVGDSMLHSRSLTVPPVNWKARNLPCRTTYTVEIVIFRCHSPDRENQTHNELNFYGYTFGNAATTYYSYTLATILVLVVCTIRYQLASFSTDFVVCPAFHEDPSAGDVTVAQRSAILSPSNRQSTKP